MAPSKFEVRGYSEHKAPKPASPSASVILVSPTNEILLLHRVQTSSAFPSAHVFPGGNLEPSDGDLPSNPTDINRHLDSLAYRTGAIRELFEESGILLARESKDAKSLLSVPRDQRQNGRDAVHKGSTSLSEWLKSISPQAVLDTGRLIPFTHWVTPPNVPKRFTTQMYLYFVELDEAGNPSVHATGDEVETMAPEWRRAQDWLSRARKGEIILFPPQFLLLYLISDILDRGFVRGQAEETREEVVRKREQLRRKIEEEGSPRWKDKFISPIGLQFGREDGRSVLALDKPGPELKGSGLQGDSEYVVLVKFNKEGPRQVDVALRKDVLNDERALKAQKQGPASKLS
jgi:8-oxo-dGTP pyrophosphatase MutT (NUDIX family)